MGEMPLRLGLSDFESHDPGARSGSGNRRFLCPLPACADHQNARLHRSVSFNTESGLWNCKRCSGKGCDPAKWKNPPAALFPSSGSTRRERGRHKLHQVFGLGTLIGPTTARNVTVSEPSPEPSEDANEWKNRLGKRRRLVGTPGGAYLEGRGLPADYCEAAGVRYASDFGSNSQTGKKGRPAVVFPVIGKDGRSVAGQGRYLDPHATPKAITYGPKALGVFATQGSLDTDRPLVVTEAPIDALTLALCGVPAVAVLGSVGLPQWMCDQCVFRTVLAAYDNDDVGEGAAEKLSLALTPNGARVIRLFPPNGFKDWNEALQGIGRDALTESLIADLEELRDRGLLASASDATISNADENSEVAARTQALYMAALAGTLPLNSQPAPGWNLRDPNAWTLRTIEDLRMLRDRTGEDVAESIRLTEAEFFQLTEWELYWLEYLATWWHQRG